VQHEVIAGESLAALRNFVSVLTRYYDFGNRNSFRKLLDFLMEPSRTEVRGSDFQSFLEKLDPPIVRKSRYIGCFSTQRGLRRFPCSLWSLFHHLTIQHLESEDNEDPMEVLHAMHGYIKHFFGCTDCAKHFQEMAKRNHIWNVTSKDQAALWLWSAHNEVNQRLAGDITEDTNHPKIQFPAEDNCHVCYKKTGEFDKTEVVAFLRRHYGNDHVNDMGIEQLPRAMMLNARARQMFSAGGNSHLHIGIFAYVVIIICLMVAAVKFYFRRGYRKKLYTHDLLGKV
jgi:thiol oxidase